MKPHQQSGQRYNGGCASWPSQQETGRRRRANNKGKRGWCVWASRGGQQYHQRRRVEDESCRHRHSKQPRLLAAMPNSGANKRVKKTPGTKQHLSLHTTTYLYLVIFHPQLLRSYTYSALRTHRAGESPVRTALNGVIGDASPAMTGGG